MRKPLGWPQVAVVAEEETDFRAECFVEGTGPWGTDLRLPEGRTHGPSFPVLPFPTPHCCPLGLLLPPFPVF